MPPSASNCKDCMVYAARGGKCHRHGGSKNVGGNKVSPSGRAGDLPTLENWEVLSDGRVKGAVYGREGFPDGQEITTGAVVSRTSTEVKTNSGSRYRLGKKKPIASASSSNKKKPLQPSNHANKMKPSAVGKPPAHRRLVSESSSDNKDNDSDEDIKDNEPQSFDSGDNDNDDDQSSILPDVGRHGLCGRVGSEKKLLGGKVKGAHDATLHEFKQDIYVGDRVRVKTSRNLGNRSGGQPAEGIVMFIGACDFADGRVMCGLRMDDRLSVGGHDGKENGERHFRCEPGMGAYVLSTDVTIVSRGGRQLKGGGFGGRASVDEDDDEEPFDLEKELGHLVGIEAVKRHILSLRNRLEVGRRRAAFGVLDSKPLHTVMVGSKGMDFTGVANVLAGMLKSLDVTAKSRVVEVSRKDLVGGNTEKTTEMVAAVMKKVGSGGVLLLSDAASMCNEKSDHYGQLALTQVVAHFEDEAAKAAEAAEKAARAKKNGNSKKNLSWSS